MKEKNIYSSKRFSQVTNLKNYTIHKFSLRPTVHTTETCPLHAVTCSSKHEDVNSQPTYCDILAAILVTCACI